mmetsp:Transcript_119402/g.343018  ORF Transcript_119402/g.343018 Transcript_119402/m.343018 type:complete len:203 (+) Transcript_119402:443-1051(+)
MVVADAPGHDQPRGGGRKGAVFRRKEGAAQQKHCAADGLERLGLRHEGADARHPCRHGQALRKHCLGLRVGRAGGDGGSHPAEHRRLQPLGRRVRPRPRPSLPRLHLRGRLPLRRGRVRQPLLARGGASRRPSGHHLQPEKDGALAPERAAIQRRQLPTILLGGGNRGGARPIPLEKVLGQGGQQLQKAQGEEEGAQGRAQG